MVPRSWCVGRDTDNQRVWAMSILEEIERIKQLSRYSRLQRQLMRAVAEEFDRGVLTKERLDKYNQKREELIAAIAQNVRNPRK